MGGERTPWREPYEESVDLYPGLVVHDGRVTGSITTGQSRLPLWAFVSTAIQRGWDEVERGWTPSDYGWSEEEMALFLYCLLEMRGEFGRLLLVLADAERCEVAGNGNPWWQTKRHRKRVATQMRRCLAALGE